MRPEPWRAAPAEAVGGEGGYALVEVLVALVVAGVVLSASYGWVWGLGALARVHDDRAQAGTIAAAAARSIADDVRAAVAVAPPTASDRSRAVTLVHDHVGAAPEEVEIVWDPRRKVIWRNAPGTYVADQVTTFVVAYTLQDGREADAEAMSPADWSLVAAVTVELTTRTGSAHATRTVLAKVGA